MEITAYTVLGVERTATQEEIAAAYRAKARQHHPDHGGDAGKMARVNLAWEKLGTPDARAAYDLRLHDLARAPASREPELPAQGPDFFDRLKAANGLNLGGLIGDVAAASGMLDAAGCERVRQAGAKGAQIGQEIADLIGLVRGHQR